MFVIPLIGKISLKNPPVVTLAIVFINCFVFFFFQSDDREKHIDAIEFYLESGLAQIEVIRYIEYFKSQNTDTDYLDLSGEIDDDTMGEFYVKMMKDKEFRNKLKKGEIISIQDPEYEKWKELNNTFEEKLNSTVSSRYGFRPSEGKPVTFITHMFLHGSTGHLVGNMIMFWLVGCILEFGCGRALYTGIYLVGGILSVSVYGLFNLGSTTQLVGASGAISGLMGAVTVLFGRKKINILLFFGIIIYLKVPAIVLLPLWVGNEIYQQISYGDISNVAYMAHAGGLAGGAALGFISWKYMDFSKEDVFEEEKVDGVLLLMEKALDAIGELDHDKARDYLNEILVKKPNHMDALTRLYDIEKYHPEDPRYHSITGKLIPELSKDKENLNKAYEIYNEYKGLVKQQRLPLPLYLKISSICAETGRPEMALKIISVLLKKKADMPGIPTVLLRLAEAYKKKGNKAIWRKCLQVIPAKFPASSEAQIAKRKLGN